jgi:hemerythrin-like domain-containing protein
MSKGLEELFTDHANMRVLLQMLECELDRYRDGKTPDFELLQSMINDITIFQNLVHHPKEDLVFARLIQREPIGAEPILDLLTDHARLAIVSRTVAETKLWLNHGSGESVD